MSESRRCGWETWSESDVSDLLGRGCDRGCDCDQDYHDEHGHGDCGDRDHHVEHGHGDCGDHDHGRDDGGDDLPAVSGDKGPSALLY